MSFKIVKGYTDLIFILFCNNLNIFLFGEHSVIYLLRIFQFIKLFCENLFWFLLSIVGFLRNMKLCLKFGLQNKCNSIIQVVKKFKDTLKSDLNSVNSRFKKVKILTGYGIKLVLNVFLPLTDFVTDLWFVSSIYGDNLFFASGIYILHTNTKFSCVILKLRFYEL